MTAKPISAELALSIALLMLAVSAPIAALADRAQPQIPDPLALSWCLDRARSANPNLARVEALASAATHRIDPAGAFDDPRFEYEASNIPTGSFDFDSTPLSGHQFGLRQKLPFPGLLSNRETAARKGAEASRLLVDDQVFVIDGAVESAWAELAFTQRALQITDRNV